MILLEGKDLSPPLFLFLPLIFWPWGEYDVFMKGAPKGTGTCWQLETLPGQRWLPAVRNWMTV